VFTPAVPELREFLRTAQSSIGRSQPVKDLHAENKKRDAQASD
jgi:hypothetical protein